MIKYHPEGTLPPGLTRPAEYVGRHFPLFTETADIFVLQHGKVLARFKNPYATMPNGEAAGDKWHEFARSDFRLDDENIPASGLSGWWAVGAFLLLSILLVAVIKAGI